MTYEELYSVFADYYERMDNLMETIDVLANASDISTAFIEPIFSLRHCVSKLDELRKVLAAIRDSEPKTVCSKS